MDRKGRLTPEDLAFIRRTFPRETNFTVGVLLDEIEALKAELRAAEARQAAGEICRMSWDEMVRRLRAEDGG